MTHPKIDAVTIDGDRFSVVVNDAKQYAIWPAAQPLPAGWHVTGFVGDAEECIAHVDEVWGSII